MAGYGSGILAGAALTLLVAAASLVLGLAIGGLGAWARLGRRPVLARLAEGYTTLIRGVPELLLLLLLYFGGTKLLSALLGRYVEVDALSAGIAALSLLSGAYATEVLRAAAAAVPAGQIEAAEALGMHRGLRFRRIILPQLWRFALPGLGNVWQTLLKDTALVSVVGLEELMRKAQIAAGATRQPFTWYGLAALAYLALTALSELALARLERRARRGIGAG